jgi:hypothetical protein
MKSFIKYLSIIIIIILCFHFHNGIEDLIYENSNNTKRKVISLDYTDIHNQLKDYYRYDYTTVKYENSNNMIYNSKELYMTFEKFLDNYNIPNEYKGIQQLMNNNKFCINNNLFLNKDNRELKDWSLLKDIDRYIFQKKLLDNINNYNDINNEIISSCNKVDNLLNNVRLGKKECSLSLLSSNEILNIISSFSQVHWIGDSLTRHMHQGAMLLLTQDLVCGGMPILRPQYNYVVQESMCRFCHCDGLFSENKYCRYRDEIHTQISKDWLEFQNISLNCYSENNIKLTKSRYQSICYNKDNTSSLLINNSISFQYTMHISNMKVEAGLTDLICIKDDKRPKLIFLQGGGAHEHRSDLFFNNTIQPYIEKLKIFQNNCTNSKIIIIFSFGNAMKHFLDELYPIQVQERTLKFNKEMEIKIKSIYPNENISIVDFFELTKEGDSSDGYHYLSSINLQKANIVFKLMKLLLNNNTV